MKFLGICVTSHCLLVMRRLHSKLLFDLKEFRYRVDNVEDGHVCTSFGQTFSKSQAAAAGSASHEGRSPFERKLADQYICFNMAGWSLPWTC
jgi:hypothetical protein